MLVLGWSWGLALASQAASSASSGNPAPPGSGPAITVTAPGANLGSLPKELIRDVIRQHIEEVRHCYEKRLTENPSLEGRLMVEFTIGPAGNVLSVAKQSSTINDGVIESCVLQAIESWTFPKPKGGMVVVRYPFVLLSSESSQLPDVHLFDAPARAVIRGHQPELGACFHAALSANPELQGRIGCLFTVADAGIVKDVSVTSSTIAADADRGLVQCLLMKTRTWRFPQLAAGSYVHTFVFGVEYDVDTTLVLPPAGPPAQVVSHGELLAAKRSGEDPVLPYAVRAKHLCGTIESRFKVCVEPSGLVSSVNLVLGIPGANRAMVDSMRAWRFAPQPTSSCYEQSLVFKIGSVTACPQGYAGPTAGEGTPPAKLVPAAWMEPERLSSPIPYLPDATKLQLACQRVSATYRLCVDQDGAVYSVEPVQGLPTADVAVRAALLRWRFKPRRTPACYLEELTYQIDGSKGCNAGPAGQR